MKSTILNIKKRVLVVEYIDKKEAELDLQTHKAFPESDKTIICLGSELTDDIAEKLVIEMVDDCDCIYYIDYTRFDDPDSCCWTPVQSFISAIEATGYYWGKNPIEEPTIEKYGWYASESPYEDSGWMHEEGEEKYYEELKAFHEAESKTFHPSQTLIFEIL